MNRRFFGKKAAGVLAAVSAAMGVKAGAAASVHPKDVFAPGKMYLGFEIKRTDHGDEGCAYAVWHTYTYGDPSGGKVHRLEFTDNPDVRSWTKAIGTFS